MRNIYQDKINQKNERIVLLLSELHSTLDLYYEPVIDHENPSAEVWVWDRKNIANYQIY